MPTNFPNFLFVTTVYGSQYLPFLSSHLFTGERFHPESTELVLWQDLPAHEIAVLSTVFPHSRFMKIESPLKGDRFEKVSRKLYAWKAACSLYPTEPICFIDVDALLVKPIDQFLPIDADLIFTWKDEALPINVGIILIRSGQTGISFLDAWIARMEKILSDPLARKKATVQSGAADQHAFRELIGFVNYDRVFQRLVNGSDMRFKGIECRWLNDSKCSEITKDTHVLHYKGVWHPALLSGQTIPLNYPESGCHAMKKYWEATKSQAGALIAKRFTGAAVSKSLNKFAPLTGRFEERGILNSEMLAVCGVCEALGAEVIIESGRYRGQSTQLIARYFADQPVEFFSIEAVRNDNAHFAEAQLRSFQKLHLLYGDSRKMIPRLVKKFIAKKVAILIDGPKGQAAIDLLHQVCRLSGSIIAGFIHDLKMEGGERDILKAIFSRVFFTDDPDYVAQYRELDISCLPSPGAPVTMHTWRPFRKGEQEIPTYGPTIAVVLPAAGDIRKMSPNPPGKSDVHCFLRQTIQSHPWKHPLFSKLKRSLYPFNPLKKE
jgi:hypothetical protein